MMNTSQMITYIVVLYFGSSGHRYIVDAPDESAALSLALYKHNKARQSTDIVDYLQDFTVKRQTG